MMIDNDDNEYFTPHGPIASREIDPMVLAWAREPPGPFVMLPDVRSGHATACVPGKCAAHCPRISPIPLP